MKKIAIALSTIIPSLLLSNTAFAEAGFYGELSAGIASNKADMNYTSTFSSYFAGDNYTETETGNDSTSEDTTSLGLRLGYQFNEYIALELGYHQYGESDDTYTDEYGDVISDKVETSSISAGLKAILPLSEQFSLFARAGMAKWDLKATSTDSSAPGDVFVLNQDDNDIYYGVGAEYSFNETISLGIEYSVIDMGWNISSAETTEYYSFSSDASISYEVSNLALLLKVSF